MRSALPLSLVTLALSAYGSTGSNIAVDRQGNIWRTGQVLTVPLTANAFQKTEAQTVCGTQQLSPFVMPTTVYCQHAFVTKQDPNGNILYATYLGGSSEDGGIAITTDTMGNAYVTGFTYSADFPVTAGVVQRHNAGPTTPKVVLDSITPFGPQVVLPGGDVFVVKFAADGTVVYSTLLGGSGSDVPTLIGVDASGSVSMAGITVSTDFPVTSNAMAHQPNSANFFARLDASAGSLTYATYSDPTIRAFDVDATGTMFLTGSSQPLAGQPGPYVTEVNGTSGQANTTFLPDLNSKFAGDGAAIMAGNSGEAWVSVSPSPVPVPSLSQMPLPPVYPLGPSFLLKLAVGGIVAETDVGSAQFTQLQQDSAGNVYAFGTGLGAFPPAVATPLLAAPCSSAGGDFVLEVAVTSPAGTNNLAAATYLRQGSGNVVLITAAGQFSVYRPSSQTLVPVDLSFTPELNFGCLANLASGQAGPGLAAGEIFTLAGQNIGPEETVYGAPDSSGRFPTSLSGVEVLVNGTAAPLLLVQAGVIQGVIPSEAQGTEFTTVVKYQGQSAPPLDAPNSFNPGIFLIHGQAAVLNQDGTVNTPANPAKLGSIVSIFATGTGPLMTPVPDGSITPLPPPYYPLETLPIVTFAGVVANVVWAGAAPGLIAGGTQINAQLPASLPAGTDLTAVPVVVGQPLAFSTSAPISVVE